MRENEFDLALDRTEPGWILYRRHVHRRRALEKHRPPHACWLIHITLSGDDISFRGLGWEVSEFEGFGVKAWSVESIGVYIDSHGIPRCRLIVH